MENNFSRSLLPPAEVIVEPGELRLGVRLPWYRSLPLSVVEVAELTIDGQIVPHGDMRFSINDRIFSLGELESQTAQCWYVLDSAQLSVHRALDPTKPHSIALTLNLYPPYIPGLTWVTRGSLTLEAQPQ